MRTLAAGFVGVSLAGVISSCSGCAIRVVADKQVEVHHTHEVDHNVVLKSKIQCRFTMSGGLLDSDLVGECVPMPADAPDAGSK